MTIKKQVHFIGIGGIGMSALARYYKALNQASESLVGRSTRRADLATEWAVSGSDLQDSKLLKELQKDGIKVKIGHKKANLPSKRVDLVIYNQAIRDNNPELKEARKRSIPILSYPEAIGKLTNNYKTIAIAGSHGKSTTTALISHVLVNAGFDPTVIIGTRVKEFGNKNFRLGKSNWLVLEADEYGKAFHNYSPHAIVVTNIDKEHLDTYKSLAGVKKSFLQFISNIQNGGILVLNEADKNLKSLEKEIKKIVKRKNINIFWYSKNQHISGLVSLGLSPALFGAHNISNATGAHALTKALGINEQNIYETIKNFSGTWRRLEPRGFYELSKAGHKFSVYDDYAHHPTEIRASLSALRESSSKFSFNKAGMVSEAESQIPNEYLSRPFIICVFQPHQTERLQLLFNDFVGAFQDADMAIFLPVYQVAGRERELRIKNKEFRKINSEYLAKAIQKKYPNKPAIYLKNPKQLMRVLQNLNSKFSFGGLRMVSEVEPLIHNSTVVMMGAGDIIKWTDLLIKKRGRPNGRPHNL